MEHKSELRDRMEHVLMCHRAKSGSKKVLAVVLVVAVLAACGSVYAFSVCAANISDKIYQYTDDGVEVETLEEIPMHEGNVDRLYENTGGTSAYTLEWTLEKDECICTPDFSGVRDDRVLMSVSFSGSNSNIRFGMVYPNDQKAYMTAAEDEDHKFFMGQKGDYKMFVQNKSSDMVTVKGVYVIYR